MDPDETPLDFQPPPDWRDVWDAEPDLVMP